MTRVSSQAFWSIEKGNSSHQPWLMTVRLKLKFRGVGIVRGIVMAAEFNGQKF